MNQHLTLQESLDVFQKKNKSYFSSNDFTTAGADFLSSHDIAHVLFGCNTTIYGEGLVKIWTTFGTTLSFMEVIRGYQSVKAYNLAKQYSSQHVTKNIFKLLRCIPKTILRTTRMTKPWPFYKYHPYLEVSLFEIRKEFNIIVD